MTITFVAAVLSPVAVVFVAVVVAVCCRRGEPPPPPKVPDPYHGYWPPAAPYPVPFVTSSEDDPCGMHPPPATAA